MASTAKIILAVVTLFLEMALNRPMPFLIFIVMIGFAVVAAGMTRRNQESSSTSTSSGINYEVFLSFRGADTRQTITDHLFSGLVDAGIKVFRDNEGLRAGEKIHPRLKEAIEKSTISIAVFSKDYASSKSCLMEVVQMWECQKSNGRIIIPIFYHISPDDVKRQAGDFETSFKKHEKDGVNAGTIKVWKNVLRQIGGLSGYDLKNIDGGHESQLVKKVLRRVRQVLKKNDQDVTDKLVGIDLHVQEMMTKLGVVYSQGQAIEVRGEEVRVVGICGLQGLGKTTLAKVVFNKIHKLFDGCSFLEDINSVVKVSQEMLIADLQKENWAPLGSSGEGKKIISSQFTDMKVLIVLDNVKNDEQIKGLAEKLTWFGPKSRIIVTTNRKNVLKGFDFGQAKVRAAEVYEVKPMGDQDALQLFRKHAFHRDALHDDSEYDSLSRDIVKAIGGLPLALVHEASNLRNKGEDIEIWRETLELLEENKGETVKAPFEASYISLDDNTKEIFLDIACFFIGKDKRIPSYMWKACGYAPARAIESLREMCSLEIGENNELRMHNLSRDFGRKLVKDKSPRKRCRFWVHSDADPILKDGEGTESVKGIGLTVEKGCTVCFPWEGFRKMLNLRYLRLDQANIQGNTENLPPNLRWLEWRECHSIPELGNMHLKELVILDLSGSLVTKDLHLEQIMKKVEKLKVLNLQGCVQLRASLEFPAPVNLEILILEGCTRLTKIQKFIGNLNKLSSLNLKGCARVNELPEELYHMESLKELVIDGTGIQEIYCQSGFLKNLETLSARNCKRWRHISTICHLTKLSSLVLDGADIVGLPDTIEFPQTLKRLSLRECRKLVKLPGSIGMLKVLEVMDLSDTVINEMPSSVKDLSNLKTLKMERTYLQKFPEYIVNLEKLEEIDFSGCRSLGGQVPCDISKLSSLRILKLSSSDVAGLPESICNLSCLQTLDILDCDRLRTLPKLPSSLLRLRWGSKKMRVPDLSYLTNLKELLLTDREQPKAGWLVMLPNLKTPNIGWITRLTSLETLQLSLSKITILPGNFSGLTQLRELSLSYMKELDLTQLPSTSRLSTLHLKHCKIRKPKLSSLKYLSELELDDCDLAEIDGLEDLQLLEFLRISHCSSIINLNGLENIGRLQKVRVDRCDRVEVERCGLAISFFSVSGWKVSVLRKLLLCFESSTGHLLYKKLKSGLSKKGHKVPQANSTSSRCC